MVVLNVTVLTFALAWPTRWRVVRAIDGGARGLARFLWLLPQRPRLRRERIEREELAVENYWDHVHQVVRDEKPQQFVAAWNANRRATRALSLRRTRLD
jgi:hypothetical protein